MGLGVIFGGAWGDLGAFCRYLEDILGDLERILRWSWGGFVGRWKDLARIMGAWNLIIPKPSNISTPKPKTNY